jgi:hypothetical protein
MKRLIGLVFLTLWLPLLVSAQDARESWDNLKRLQAGQKIEVVDMELKSVRGTFVSYAEDGISLQTDNGPVSLERARVMRVSLREHSKRARNALIGAAIGAGIGVGLGLAAARTGVHETGEEYGVMVIFTPIAAGAGAGLGAAIPGYETIYRAQKRRT